MNRATIKSEGLRSVPLIPTWHAAFTICIAALENGTSEGKEHARAELMRAASILDRVREEQEAA